MSHFHNIFNMVLGLRAYEVLKKVTHNSNHNIKKDEYNEDDDEKYEEIVISK